MLQDLYQIDRYFDDANKAIYEAELVKQYGEKTVLQAIADGWLEHRRMPFRCGDQRCICWLSDSARERIAAQLESPAKIN